MYDRYYSRDDGIGYEAYGKDSSPMPVDYVLLDVLKGLGHSKGDSVLDVGCATGSRVAYFRNMGFIASGVDISAEAVEYGRKTYGVDLHPGRFEDFSSIKLFDIVTMIDFIEHLPSPESWTQKVKELTRVSSSLLILTPDFDCYRAYGERWIGYNRSYEHVLFYSRRSLGSLLERLGFMVRGSLSLSTLPVTVEISARQDEWPWPAGKMANARVKIPPLESIIRLALLAKGRLTYQRLVSRDGCANSLLLYASRGK
jgi:SAM-dependent methyltransferase